MVEYKSTRDVETFSKFLENGGTLPEEPPAVSEVPPHQGPPTPTQLPAFAGRDQLLWDGDRDRRGGVSVRASPPLSSPGAPDTREQHRQRGAEFTWDGRIPG